LASGQDYACGLLFVNDVANFCRVVAGKGAILDYFKPSAQFGGEGWCCCIV
jgi:hypothetical protein